MKALILREDRFGVEEVEQPEPGSGQVLVKMHAAALNRRDQWIREGKYPKIVLPAQLGSDGCGEVLEAGDSVGQSWIGKRIIINPNNNWGANPKVQNREYHILGMPTKGTLAEYLVVDIDRLHEAPAYLDNYGAAALPLGGLTAYNALINKGGLDRDKKVLISGVGGGVAQFAFQFALAVGASVWVTSGKESVLETCLKMGARGGANYKDAAAVKSLAKESGGFDIIIDSAGGDGLDLLMSTLAGGGKLVLYGATNGLPTTLNLRNIFWNQLSLMGSTMGSDQDFEAMLQFVQQYKIRPVIDKIFPLENAVAAFDRMKAGEHFGKIVVSIGDKSHD
jgi:NADPH:quinone reductase-like Zn-dependent oxidoreductase